MIQKLLEFIKSHPQLVVAQDFELACQKTKIKKQQYLDGQPGIQSFDEGWWVQLKVLHRNKAGIAIGSALSENTLDRLVGEALLSAERSTRDPWFRFPVWSTRKEETIVSEAQTPSEGFWDSSWLLLEANRLPFQEWYEWSEIETVLYRRSEKLQKTYRRGAAHQQWSLGRCHESFWGEENREKRIRQLQKAAVCLENAAQWDLPRPSVFSISGKAMSPILQKVSSWFHADAIQGKKSPLSGVEENAPIMSTGVTLSDDGSQIPSFLSGPFDLDGISEQRTPLVKEGQFKGALYDAYSGGIDNRRSTGNRVRDFLDLEPKLRAKAMCLEPGSVSPEVFWKEMKNGFAISGWSRLEICSNRQLEGDAFGWKVEDGSFVGAFRIEGIKWDLMDLMNRIVGVASDSQKHGLSISPTVFLKGTV